MNTYMHRLHEYILAQFHAYLHPFIHYSMGSAPVGLQCPIPSSIGEFPGSGILGFRLCWCPSPFPSPSISRCFPFTLLQLSLDFIRTFFTVAVSAPRHQPSSFHRPWDRCMSRYIL